MGQYAISHSNGSTFNIYDLEQNGPNNISNPRQIFSISLGGGAGFNSFNILNDLTYRFSAGLTFTILDSGSNDGIYTVTNSSFDGTYTTISVNEVISGNTLPYGALTYSIPTNENETSLLLSGKGVINFGQSLIENYVKLLENFANSTAPDYPNIGQQWYNTTTDQFQKYDSSLNWTSSINIGNDILSFIDPQNPFDQVNPILEIKGDNDDTGLSLKTTVNPNSTDSIFRILSSDNNERLRIEHNGFVSTSNALKSTNTSLVNVLNNDLQFPSTKGLVSTNNATIQTNVTGNTWVISSGNPGTSDSLIVSDSTGSSLLRIRTDNDSVEVAKDFVVNTTTLYVDSTLSNVGIGKNNPTEKLDVLGNITASGQYLGSNGTVINPSLSFTSNPSVGLRLIGTGIGFSTAGTDKMILDGTGLLSVNTVSYENLVVNDNDIPNKRYVDNKSVASSGKLYFFGFGS